VVSFHRTGKSYNLWAVFAAIVILATFITNYWIKQQIDRSDDQSVRPSRAVPPQEQGEETSVSTLQEISEQTVVEEKSDVEQVMVQEMTGEDMSNNVIYEIPLKDEFLAQ